MKLKIRDGEEQKYNRPWNIATNFDVDMSFSKEEIETMLTDYVDSKGIKLDKKYFSEKLNFYTSGYPFLVSKLCKIIDEKIMNPEIDLGTLYGIFGNDNGKVKIHNGVYEQLIYDYIVN